MSTNTSMEMEEIDGGDSDTDQTSKFLPRSCQKSLHTPRGSRSSSMFHIVLDAMRFNRRDDRSQPGSTNVTPSVSRRDLSTVETKSPSAKRKLWAISRKNLQKNTRSGTDAEEAVTDAGVCLISDGPNYVFQMAAKGNVKQLANVFNANPARMLSRDIKGATVLHHAAMNQKMAVMDLVLADPAGSELLDSVDETYSTPIHWAAAHNKAESIEYLISKGADPSIKNNSGEAPLHSSISKKAEEALRQLIKHKGIININETMTTSGGTALHLTASTDYEEGAKLLLAAGAKQCMPDQQGYRPIHCAAFAGSKNVMKVLLENCHKSFNYTPEQVLSYSDKELCSPLHCAVLGGNADAIAMCLSYGARLDKQQADLTTPMHLVCSQGAFDIVKLMFGNAQEQAIRTLSMEDKQKHTPLHKAAMYGHANIVQYLVQEGADTDIPDADQNSPLLLAASRENWICVRDLIEVGANLLLKNKDDRNLMHMIVLKGGDIKNLDFKNMDGQAISETCRNILCKPEVHLLLNEADSFGCTPLHYACQEGNLASLETLMKYGVSARMKSTGNQSPLHFAAMYGRYNACKKLINSPQGPNIINDKDDKGMTPLHFAAQNGHIKVVQLLLNKGAVFHRTVFGESVLHVASANGYTRTIKTLVNMNRTLIDEVDDEGNTSLHVASRTSQVNVVHLLLDLGACILRNKSGATFFAEAIMNQNREVALTVVEHERWEEPMQTFSTGKETFLIPTLLLIQHLPDVWVVAMNRCIDTADCSPKSKKFWIKYKFKYLQPSIKHREEIKEEIIKSFGIPDVQIKEQVMDAQTLTLPALNKMVAYNRVECLRHPVSVAYLRMKWNAYGSWFHGLNLFIYMLGVIPLTYLTCTMDSHNHRHGPTNTSLNITYEPKTYPTLQFSMMILLTILSICQIIKEVVQMVQQKGKYFTDMTNLLEWMLYVSSLLYVTPFYTSYPVHWQFEFGAVAILLAWFNFLLFLQRFDIAGIYVVMFIEILHTLLKVLAVFSFLIIAFSLSFYVLMNNETDKSFSTPLLSIMRIITMTLGEIGYVEKFLEPYVDADDANTLHFSVASMILLALFILIMPILLMNLLIGLAVGDIAEVQNNAALQRLAMQVQLHTDIESKLSFRILSMIDKDELTIYPNRKCGLAKKLWGYVADNTSSITDEGNILSMTDRNINYLSIELQKQKGRIKDIQTLMQKQHDLMRLIVQKMEIRSEADDQDEGFHPDAQRQLQLNRSRFGKTSSVSSKLFAMKALKSTSQ